MNTINYKLVEIALTQVQGDDFEKFANVLLTALTGVDYVPLGGTRDGGADGFLDSGIYGSTRAGRFHQASIQANHKDKIRQTVKRLKCVKRSPTSLIYIAVLNFGAYLAK